jgi:hypothetical protein
MRYQIVRDLRPNCGARDADIFRSSGADPGGNSQFDII